MFGAVVYAANWRFVLGHSAYAAGYQAPSALLHYWSLAIEEQAYVVLPLLVVVVLRRRTSIRRLATAVGVLMAASALAALLIHDPNRAYFGTDTRSFELLAGAAARPRGRFPGYVRRRGGCRPGWRRSSRPARSSRPRSCGRRCPKRRRGSPGAGCGACRPCRARSSSAHSQAAASRRCSAPARSWPSAAAATASTSTTGRSSC